VGVGYAMSPPVEDEKRTLLRLFGACLVGDQAIHEPIMQGLVRLGEAQVCSTSSSNTGGAKVVHNTCCCIDFKFALE
jgi:hypothetical protein